MLLVGLLPLLLWWQVIQSPLDYFLYPTPPGQLSYIFSRLSGLYAVLLLGIQVMLGISGRGGRFFRYHRLLGSLVVMTVVLHVGLFMIAVWLRSGTSPLDLLIPKFSEGYFNFSLGLGVLAFWLIPVVVVAGVKRIDKTSLWSYVHKVALSVFLLVVLHSLLIGTETGSIFLQTYYGAISFVIIISLARRLISRRLDTAA